MRVASAMACSRLSTVPSEPGTTGMPRSTAARFAATLSPIMRMCSTEGPMKTKPCSSTISAKPGFSARKPSPGWIASAPVICAAERIAGMLR